MSTTTKPNICYIGIDETEHWNIPPELKPYIARIYGVYAFDRNTYTHCCELTPSHWLECVGFDWHPTPDFRLLPDGEQDEVGDKMSEYLLDVPAHESSHYRHVKWVEDRIRHDAHCGFYEAGDLRGMLDGDDFDRGSTAFDVMSEYWHANPRF